MPDEFLTPHPDFSTFTSEEIKVHIKQLENDIAFGSVHGAEKILVAWWFTERKIAEAELARRNGTRPPSQQPEFWPELLSAKDALALPPDPTRWIWEDVLPVRNLSLLVAKPKVGKSTFAVALSICIARGYPFLGRGMQQGAVAYLSLDAALADILETFKTFGLKNSDPVYLHAGRAPDKALAWLLEQVTKHAIRFVVIDTMQRLFRFKDLNDYATISNDLEPVLDSNAHIMLLHHAGKAQGDDLDSAIGSTALRGLAYSFLHLKRLPDSTQRIFRTDQRGGRNYEEIAISDGANGYIEKVGTKEDAEIDHCKPLIREFLIEEANPDGITEKEIRLAVSVRGRVLVRAVRRMLASNDLERIGNGKRGSPYRYFLSGILVPGNKEEEETRELELIVGKSRA
ncbi:MAG TPA: AAA family ATPase [Candidatus Paceibacterota bacterium]|nr:AAA family ATPase [Candidatus Paceibacterota bacterium]